MRIHSCSSSTLTECLPEVTDYGPCSYRARGLYGRTNVTTSYYSTVVRSRFLWESREGAASEPLPVSNGFAEAGQMTMRSKVSVIIPYYWYNLSV